MVPEAMRQNKISIRFVMLMAKLKGYMARMEMEAMMANVLWPYLIRKL